MAFRLTVEEKESKDRIEINVDPTDRMTDTVKTLKTYWNLKDEYQLYFKSKPLQVNTTWFDSEIESGDMLYLEKISSVKTLPSDMWIKRINNELDVLRKEGYNIDVREEEDDIYIDLNLEDTPGPVLIGKSVGTSFKHQVRLHLNREYPFSPPSVTWKTSIFHPNVLPPEDGGCVNMGYIDGWELSHNLSVLISKMEKLLLEPDIDLRHEHPICLEAAERFIDS